MLTAGRYQYTLNTHWRIPGNISDAYEILTRPLDYPKWWGLKDFTAIEISGAGADSLGQTVQFEMKGWLPYRLRWQLRAIEAEKPHHIAGVSKGDFEGLGVWSLKQDNGWADITFNWGVTVQHPFLRRWAMLLRPLFLWNHHWVMNKSKQGMEKMMSARYV